MIPANHYLMLLSRSGLAAEGITVQGGLIDADFRGVIHVLLHNSNKNARRITKGEKVAQGVILPIQRVCFIHGLLDQTDSRDSGFGSTGTGL